MVDCRVSCGFRSGSRLGNRRIVSAVKENPVQHGTGRCELDTHADTCIAGHGFAVYEETGHTCKVYPFSEKYKPLKVKIVNAITVYTNFKGVSVVLLFNNVLYLPDMEVSLICPNQLRDNGLIVEDCPKQFDPKSGHCIRTPDGSHTIPLEMDGVMSGFDITKPTKQLQPVPV